jgi:aminoglycoside phosphotransferase
MNATAFSPRTAASIVLAHDPALPQRDLLLDEREIASRLSQLLGANGPIAIERCEKQRIKYRIGDSLRVLYRVQVNGSSHMVAARISAARNHEGVFEQALVNTLPCSSLRSAVHDPELQTVFWLYPNDRKIEGLNALDQIPPSLSKIGDANWIRSELVAYAPEKCATARCLDGDGAVIGYAKLYAGDEGQTIFQTYRALSTNLAANKSGSRIASALTYSTAHRLLLLESVQGSRVADLRGGDLRRGLCNLGNTLAALHRCLLPNSLPRFTRLDADKLGNAATLISRARPDVAEAARRLAFELCSQLPPVDDFVCLHGDVHPKNGIARNEQVTLIDIDQAAAGPAAADLGSLLAALRYNRCVGSISESDESALAESFLSGYRQVHPLPDAQSLRWHMAAALLAERALRSVNRIRPEGLLHLRELLSNACEILRSEGHS